MTERLLVWNLDQVGLVEIPLSKAPYPQDCPQVHQRLLLILCLVSIRWFVVIFLLFNSQCVWRIITSPFSLDDFHSVLWYILEILSYPTNDCYLSTNEIPYRLLEDHGFSRKQEDVKHLIIFTALCKVKIITFEYEMQCNSF